MSQTLRQLLVPAILVGVVVGAVLLLDPLQPFEDRPQAPACAKSRGSDLALRANSAWKLTRGRNTKLALALDDRTSAPRRTKTHVDVVPTNRRRVALRTTTRVGAYLKGELTDGKRDIGMRVVTIASRGRDGRVVKVALCAQRRARRELTHPGRYTGAIRVAGPRIEPVDVPLEVTIRGDRWFAAFLAVVASLIGAGIAAYNSKPANVTEAQVQEKPGKHFLLGILPFLSGVVAGLLAAYVVYIGDATWADEQAEDTVKLIVAAFAGATGGLAATVLPAKAARERIAR